MYIPSWQGLSPAYLAPGAQLEPAFPVNAGNKICFYVARNAIYHLFRALGLRSGESVLMPDYHSGNEVWAVRAAGVAAHYYHIGRDVQPDFEELERLCLLHRPRVMYLIHYLGWPQPVKLIQSLCLKYNMILVEDCALSMLSELDGRPLGSFGDFSIFCLYKTLPVPHGGLLVQNTMELDGLKELALSPCGRRSVAGRSLELMLEWYRSRAVKSGAVLAWLKARAGQALSRLHVNRVPVGDIGFDITNVNLGMSGFCGRLLSRFDYPAIRERRRANYLLLQERLQGRVTLLYPRLDEGVCPLFFPILAPDKHALARSLWQRNIGAVEFWNYGDAAATGPGFENAQFLRDHVLELPIHQDIRPAQIEYVAEQVLRLNTSFEKTAAAGCNLAIAG